MLNVVHNGGIAIVNGVHFILGRVMELVADPVVTDWLEEAARFPVAFAQVREDALIDRFIAGQLPEKARGLMIASGGCTAALLAAEGRFAHLTLADLNLAQLDLARLKLAMVAEQTPHERMELLGHTPMPAETRKTRLIEVMDRHGIAPDRFGPIDRVAEAGLDQVGRYEWLFHQLRQAIGDADTTESLMRLENTDAQAAFLRDQPAYVARLERAFAEVMALPNLVRLFGEGATQNAVMPFAQHFLRRTEHVLHSLPAATNPWLAQLLLGRFEATAYPWLDLPQQSIATQIDYQLGAMAEVLAQTDERFEFIHLSNILDWLSADEAAALLERAATRLRPGGWLIIRQLNSALDIPALGAKLDWQTDISARLHAQDRSFFYQSLHIARPCM